MATFIAVAVMVEYNSSVPEAGSSQNPRGILDFALRPEYMEAVTPGPFPLRPGALASGGIQNCDERAREWSHAPGQTLFGLNPHFPCVPRFAITSFVRPCNGGQARPGHESGRPDCFHSTYGLSFEAAQN
jgi:hypothetical protein